MNKDEIAQIMQDTSGMIWGDEAHFQRFAKQLINIEREACAKVCEERGMVKGGEVFSARIRARSNT